MKQWSATGAVLFARYAYPPNALGYCGPTDLGALPGATATGDLDGLVALAPSFEGAWPYLELIAASNGLRDPLDHRVVEAYWTGNSLLDRVPPAALVASLDERFRRRLGRYQDPLAQAAAMGGCAHHSFHVFAVYPWLGLLRSGSHAEPLRILDRCRIRAGRVEALDGPRVAVRSAPLVFDGATLRPGPPELEWVWTPPPGPRGEPPVLAVGDTVSMHWDWVCERISRQTRARLDRYTERNLASVNALPVPGPRFACDRWG